MKTILPAMQQSWLLISQLKLNANSALSLPDFEVIPIIEDYCNFLQALTFCKKIAIKEYEEIKLEALKVSNLNSVLEKLRKNIEEVEINDAIAFDDEVNQANALQTLRQTSDKFSHDFRESLHQLIIGIKKLGEDLQDFKVVLFGRTKVGKSTVREALTKGNGETIGKGGQSTTVEINKYSWYNLTVYDTPGTLSVKDTHIDTKTRIGDEERKAYELLEKADIALFMFATDNIEEPELEYLQRISKRGRKILVLLNVKNDVSDYRKFRLRRAEKTICGDSQAGHIKRIKSRVPDASFEIIPVHAQAAFFSRAEKNKDIDKFYQSYGVQKSELYQLSKFADIRNHLVENIVNEGAAIRCQTIREYFIHNLNELAQRNVPSIDNCLETSKEILSKIEKTKKSIESKFDNFEDKLSSLILVSAKDVIDTHEFATRCIEDKYSKDAISNSWANMLESELKEIPGKVFKEFMSTIKDQLEELANQVNFIYAQNDSFGGFEADSLPWQGMFKIGGFVAGFFGFAAAVGCIPGGGWAVGALAVLAAVLSWFVGLFKSKTTKIRELAEKLDESLNKCTYEIAEQIRQEAVLQTREKLFSLLDNMIKSQEQMISIASKFKQLNDLLFAAANSNKEKMEARLNELGKVG